MRFLVVFVLVSGACDWVSFDDPGDDDRGDGGADADGDADADADADADGDADVCEPACADGLVCADGQCLDARVDQDGDGFPLSVDCDDHDEDVVPGSTRRCKTACGAGVATCAEGTWGACSAPEDCSCSPDETRDEPCGRCGIAVRACTPEGTWGALGACGSEGECSPHAEEVTACPEVPCSVHRRTCSDTCAWEAFGACEGGLDDADGDGHVAEACGGDDCNDGDSTVHPGAVEDETWAFETVDAAGQTGYATALALDAPGALHVAYLDGDAGTLRYATNASGAWVTETIDADATTGLANAIAVDADGAVHVSTLACQGFNGNNCYDGDLRYATNASGAWVVDTIDEGGDTGYESSLAIDADGTIHIVYRECASTNGGLCYDGDLRHATNGGAGWQLETLDDDGDTGYSTGLVLDDAGRLHVSFVTCASTNGGLCYDGDLSYGTDASGAWQTETVDEDPDVGDGEGTSIVLGPAGAVRIAYLVCNGSNGGFGCYDADLRTATNAGGAWATAEIDVAGDTGYWPSLRLDAAGSADVAYYDWDNGDLRFATDAGGAWSAESLDAANDSGAYPSMVVTSDVVAISYLDATAHDLRVARRSAPDGVDDDCDGNVW